LDNTQINQYVTLTGTINSGGLVGQVGGLPDKLEAAAEAGLKKVLIPEGERYVRISNRSSLAGRATSNGTTDLLDYGKTLGLEVIEVSDIQETLLQLTGKNYSDEEKNLEIDTHY
ncbi:MAG TPA: S16 family serine protease, partial [Candidatus Nanoarchaeia archaeon]|nr:S16 family serine protease [Candidatus Nanoarchaeia archaeon]